MNRIIGVANTGIKNHDGSSVIYTITTEISKLSQKLKQKSQSSILATNVNPISSHWFLSQ